MPSVTANGNGRVVGLVLTPTDIQGVSTTSGDVLAVLYDNHCYSAGCAASSPTQIAVLSPALASTEQQQGSSKTYDATLPAGEYTLQVIADGAPVTVSLTLGGLTGRAALAPTQPTDLQLSTANPTVPAVTPQAEAVWQAPASGTLSGAGGLAVAIVDLQVTPNPDPAEAAGSHGLCVYAGAGTHPPAGPSCPGGIGVAIIGPPQSSTGPIYSYGLLTAGTFTIDEYVNTPGDVTSANGDDLFISYDGPSVPGGGQVPEAPASILLVLAGVLAAGATVIVSRRRKGLLERTALPAEPGLGKSEAAVRS